jgi:hypothetical protein
MVRTREPTQLYNIIEFNDFNRANNFIENTDFSSITAFSYIPPSYVEIIGVINGLPEEYSD